MKVSLVIPTYNRGAVLANTIDMAIRQDYDDFEVIVVDQSLSPSVNAGAYQEYGDRIRFLRLPIPNLPAARNAGVLAARGDIIVFIDDDVLLSPEYVASHVANYNNRSVGGVMGLTLSPDCANRDSLLAEAQSLFEVRKVLSDAPMSVSWMNGGNSSYRRRAILVAGLSDERFGGSGWCEDVDLAVRVRHHGYELLLDPNITLVHLALPSGGCRNRDAASVDRTEEEHVRLFAFFNFKNRHILGLAEVWRNLWHIYRHYALNRRLLKCGPRAIIDRQCKFATALAQAARICSGRPDSVLGNGSYSVRPVGSVAAPPGRVSVVIPCYNASDSIADALQSVLAHHLADVEVIVVDDGSTDDSANIIERDFGWVRLLRTTNRGPSPARSLGTAMASGAFIQYLDADDMLAPGKLQAQMAALERTDADIAYGDWEKVIPDSDGAYQAGPVISRKIEGPAEIALFTDFWCPPAAYLFRREIVERVSWNVGLPVIQDARFVLDCALRGARFVYTPGIVARYRVHKSGSVSSRDPIAFVRDCFKNATEVESWWIEHGGITSERRKALLQAYGYVARASFEKDQPTFNTACAALERLMPGYVPDSPRQLAVLSRLAGYRRAESVALAFRKAKRLVHAS